MTCQVDGCARPHKARGLCQTHYAQRLRGVDFSPIRSRVREKAPECVEDGCVEPVKSIMITKPGKFVIYCVPPAIGDWAFSGMIRHCLIRPETISCVTKSSKHSPQTNSSQRP